MRFWEVSFVCFFSSKRGAMSVHLCLAMLPHAVTSLSLQIYDHPAH